jgi:hypothetical protein
MTNRSSYSVANWLLCLANNALVAANRDPIQRSLVAAGEIAWDNCCGMLVAAPERVFRSISFPSEFTTMEYCDTGHIAHQLVLLLVRCTPAPDARGNAPAEATLDAAYRSFLEDAAVVWNAIECADMPDEWQRASLSQTFVGAQGGCIGVETRVTIGVPEVSWSI